RPANHFPAPLLDGCARPFIKFAQWDSRNPDHISSSRGKKRLPENVQAITRFGARKFLVQGADEYDRPEPRNGALALAMRAEPLQHAAAHRVAEIGRAS